MHYKTLHNFRRIIHLNNNNYNFSFLKMQVATFTWLDYFFFALMLISSALVGVYYGFVQKQNTADDYLLGGKRMNIWPTAMSIVSR